MKPSDSQNKNRVMNPTINLDDKFKQFFNYVAQDVYRVNCANGWWEDASRNFGEAVALMHSELSEALEAQRTGNPPDDKLPAFSGVEVELADTIIRIMDWAVHNKLDVAGALVSKVRFNATRGYKHGGKKF